MQTYAHVVINFFYTCLGLPTDLQLGYSFAWHVLIVANLSCGMGEVLKTEPSYRGLC